jgi:hypothetical protein
MTGGSACTYTLTNSSTAAEHRAFFAPYASDFELGSDSNLSVLVPGSSTWIPVGNYGSSGVQIGANAAAVMPLIILGGTGASPVNSLTTRAQGYCYGNSDRVIRPISIVCGLTGFIGSYGALDGVFHVSGEGMASEYTLTIGGDTYLCIQSTFNTNRESFAAFKLE